jgi:hypothetical protein
MRIHPNHPHRHDRRLLPLSGLTTVAGMPNSRDHRRSRSSLSHATARPRQAGTSSASQNPPRGLAGGNRASRPGPLNATEPGSLPFRPSPQRLPTTGRVGARGPGAGPITESDVERKSGSPERRSGCEIRVAARCRRGPAAAMLVPWPDTCSTAATSLRVRRRLRLVQRQPEPASPPRGARLLPFRRARDLGDGAGRSARGPAAAVLRCTAHHRHARQRGADPHDRQERRDRHDEGNHRAAVFPGSARRTSPL